MQIRIGRGMSKGWWVANKREVTRHPLGVLDLLNNKHFTAQKYLFHV